MPGAPPYAGAPERMRGQPVNARTDIYALGLLAFHMLTGAPAHAEVRTSRSSIMRNDPR